MLGKSTGNCAGGCRRLPLLRWLGLLLVLASGGPVVATAAGVLEGIEVVNLPGGQVQLRFRLSQPPAAVPNSFTINDPARIVLDFADTRNGMSERQRTIDSGAVQKVSVLEGSGRTRASVNLTRLLPYQVRTEGKTVTLTLEPGSGVAPAPAPSVSATPAARPSRAAAGRGPRSVNGLDFRRSPEGAAVISLRLSDPTTPVDVRQEGNQIIVDFQGALLPPNQQRRLDVSDFATPVSRVEAVNQVNRARLTIQPTSPFEYLVYQADNLYTVEVKRPERRDEKEEEVDPRQRVYTGELLSLNFQNIEVRAVLQIIADFTGQNVVVSDTVQGNLTLRLQNVPWDQALDIILRTKGLTLRQNGNVMYIAPTEEVAAREKLELEARKTVTELVPLRTELIQVNYAKASDLEKLLKSTGGEGAKGGTTSLLSPRGQVTVDSRTNSLLVQDIPDRLTEIRNLVTRLDRPVRQVMIDSRVVIANDDYRKELGIRWGFTGVRKNGDNGIVTTTGGLGGTSTIVNSAIDNLQTSGQPFPVALPPIAERLGVNLPVADPFGRVALAILGKDYLVDMELSALQSEGRGEILSNPRVVTTDRAAATIRQGREIPYQTSSGDTGPTTEFKKAELELTVTPQITPDDRVIMDLNVKKNEIGQNVGTITGAAIPSIDTREVITQVLVDNGDTVVLGGVFEQTNTRGVDKVPFLGDLPGIGGLFRRNTTDDVKRELLIFVTPQILKENMAVR